MIRLSGTIGLGWVPYSHGRVLRGGSWINNAENLRCARRNHNRPDNRNHNTGLRLAEALRMGRIAGGSVNQHPSPLRDGWVYHAQKPGPRRASRYPAKPLPPGRLTGVLYGI